MKCQHLVGAVLLSTAAVSASELAETGQCPAGYTMTTYVVTMSATPASETIDIPPSTTETASSTMKGEAAVSVSSTSAPSEITVPESQLAAITTVSSTESPDPVASTSTSTSVSSETPAAATQQPDATSFSSTESSDSVTSTPAPSETQQADTTSSSTQSSAAAPTTTTVSTTSEEVSSSQTSTSSAQATSTSPISQTLGTWGEATYYNGIVADGTCSFSGYTLPSGIFGTALSVDTWDHAAKCGACVAITGPTGNTIKAMIVDQCPSCPANHFDLFADAFGELSQLSTGLIDITWSYTFCDLAGPLKLRNAAGTSAYWFSMQVVNANEPVVALEVSTDGGETWQGTSRTYYNYFEESSGFGTGVADVRVTGVSGRTVVVNGVRCLSGLEIAAGSNL